MKMYINNTLIPTFTYGGISLRKTCGKSSTEESIGVEDTKITFLTEGQRVGFFVAYLLIFTIAITSNVISIIVTIKRKMRALQKTWTISLALSDIIVALFLGANNMVMLSHPMNNWILGSFMCAFVPYMQNTGQIANSITMALIAYDRYRNIVHSTNNQWNPKRWICAAIFFVIWILPSSISFPQWKISHLFGPFIAYTKDPNKPGHASSVQLIYLCQYSKPKELQLIFYTLIGCVTFIPLMCLFLYLYFKIAQLIWRRRRSPTAKYNNNSVTMETSTGDTKISGQMAVRRTKSIMKSNKLHMEKKIRTFKIILVIMLVFFLCRMPHWIFNVVRFSMTTADTPIYWVTSYALSFILILNTAINPFLYSFLNQTIVYIDKFFITFGDFISKICCCCCSEFDDYERENSQFNRNSNDQKASQNSNIVPRGPYVECINCKPNHVKFDDVAMVNTYLKDDLRPIGFGVI